MDLQLAGKTALVTGASAGIGRGIAKRLAAEGVLVVAVARRRQLLDSLAAEIENEGGRPPSVIVQDVTEADAAERLLDGIGQLHGRLDILVNNAGGSQATTLETPNADWDARMLLNYTRPRELTHAFLPGMISANWGRVINITGIGEPRNLNATLPAKAAMHSWSKGLSREVGRYGVTVNCIAPGRIVSDQARRDFTAETMREFSEGEIPIGRFGNADELAVFAAFLASPLAGYITGTVLAVDGGFSRFQH